MEDRTTSKISGQFQKAKLRLRRLFSLQPKVQHYSTPASLRVTNSRNDYDPPFGLHQDDTLTLESPPPLISIPRFQKQLAVFDVGEAKPRINRRLNADLVTLSKRGLYPLWLHTTVISARVEVLLFEIAHCLWICSSFYSNFEKQNRKGSPTSLIYPYIGKLTSFVIKQFFSFGKVHQTLSRSRLSAVLLHPSSRCDDYFRKTSTHASRSLRVTS